MEYRSRNVGQPTSTKRAFASWSGLLSRVSAFASRISRPVYFLLAFLPWSYIFTTFLISRLAAMHSRITEEAYTKDALKKRFQQNQNDVAFTVMALLPTLSKGVSKSFDVDSITHKLRDVGANRRLVQQGSPLPTNLEPLAAESAVGTHGSSQGPEAGTEPQPSPMPPNALLPDLDDKVESASVESIRGQQSNTSDDGIAQGNAVDQSVEPSSMVPSPTPALPLQGNFLNGHRGNEYTDGETSGEKRPLPAVQLPEQPRIQAEDAGDQRIAREAADTLPNSPEEAQQRQVEPIVELASGQGKEQDQEPQSRSEAASLEGQKQQDQAQSAILEHRSQVENAVLQNQLALDRKRKMELWNELKVVAISRVLTSIYAINLLSFLTHVQLNLLGRYAYLFNLSKDATTWSAATPDPSSISLDPFEDAWAKANYAAGQSEPARQPAATDAQISSETDERYLTFSWYFLHQGCSQLSERIRSKVEQVMSSVTLKTQMNHAETTALLGHIKRKIEYDYEQDFSFGSPSKACTPRVVDGGASFPHEGPSVSGKMTFGAECLMPNGLNGFEDESMRVSVMSGSTSQLGGRSRRKRFNLLAFLLPSTPRGDLDLLSSSGLLPASKQPASMLSYDSNLATLLDETRDILESRDAGKVLKKCVNASFGVLIESLRTPFGLASSASAHAKDGAGHGPLDDAPSSSSLRELEKAEDEVQQDTIGGRRLKLAAVLPLLARQSSRALDSVPNEFVDAIGTVKDLKALSAIIYSSWTTTQ